VTAVQVAGIEHAVPDLVAGVAHRHGDWRRDRTVGLEVELSEGIDLVLALRGEALSLLDRVEPIVDAGLVQNPDGSVTTDRRLGFSSAGRVLQAIQCSPTLLATMRACTGIADLRPGRAGYNVYRSGDYLGIHRDTQKVAVTVVLDLLGNLADMGWAPGLAGAPSSAVLELARTDGVFPAGQPSLPVPRDHLRAFDGAAVPHWRSPFQGALGLLALCSFTAD